VYIPVVAVSFPPAISRPVKKLMGNVE
jgi:hypothetical protein